MYKKETEGEDESGQGQGEGSETSFGEKVVRKWDEFFDFRGSIDPSCPGRLSQYPLLRRNGRAGAPRPLPSPRKNRRKRESGESKTRFNRPLHLLRGIEFLSLSLFLSLLEIDFSSRHPNLWDRLVLTRSSKLLNLAGWKISEEIKISFLLCYL